MNKRKNDKLRFFSVVSIVILWVVEIVVLKLGLTLPRLVSNSWAQGSSNLSPPK
jgi:hypothetical protein